MPIDAKFDQILATKIWLEDVVIGENFCPFAKKEFERQRIRYHQIKASSLADMLWQIEQEFKVLDNDSDTETTLLLFSSDNTKLSVECFDDFLFIVEEANRLLVRMGYEGIYQIATFHPQYLFAGEPEDSPSHYTNRSPYPMLHIIRENSIDRALRTYKDPESIPVINVERSLALGVAYFKQQLLKARNAGQ